MSLDTLTCVEHCNAGEAAVESNGTKTCTKCAGDIGKISVDGRSCVQVCKEGEIIDNLTNQCKVCVVNTVTKLCEACPTDKPYKSSDSS